MRIQNIRRVNLAHGHIHFRIRHPRAKPMALPHKMLKLGATVNPVRAEQKRRIAQVSLTWQWRVDERDTIPTLSVTPAQM